tara:strand:+ start:307 stop:435 length:129 start_codon:yes stop_codon:yes gene_type:complete
MPAETEQTIEESVREIIDALNEIPEEIETRIRGGSDDFRDFF